MDRQDIGSWIAGPRAALDAAGIDLGYRGERLGLPEQGPGSVSGYGRRFGAIFIDWICCAIIATLLTPFPYGSQGSSLATLGIFFIVKSVFTMLGGASFGQRLCGIKVVALGRPFVNPGWALLRTLLLCLVIPAVIWDRDGRGLHERATGTVTVKAR